MNNKKPLTNIIQKKVNESFLILDFEIIDDKFKSNVIIHEEVNKNDDKLIKYLIKNFHKQKLEKPYLQHIYQIISILINKHKKYYNWLRYISLPKLNKFVQIKHNTLYLFIPKIDEISNRVVDKYLQQNILNSILLTVLKKFINLIKEDKNNDSVENKLNIMIKSIFKESNKLLETKSLTLNNPALCLINRSNKEFICYLKEDTHNNKSIFKIDCRKFRTNSFYTKILDKFEKILYDQFDLESQKIYFIGVDQFYSELFINNLLNKLWIPNLLSKQLTAYTCENTGSIIYESLSGSSNLEFFFKKRENKNNYKLLNSILLQLYGSLLMLQDPYNGMILLHKQLSGDSIQVVKGSEESIIFEELNIDYYVLESIFSTFETKDLINLEEKFRIWIKNTYEFEENSDNNDEDEDYDEDDEDVDDVDDIDYVDEDINDEDLYENNNNQVGGKRKRKKRESRYNSNKNEVDVDDVDDLDVDDVDTDDENNSDVDNNYKIDLINGMKIVFSNFNKASISTLIEKSDKSRTLMRLHSIGNVDNNSNDKIDKINYEQYTDIGSIYTINDYTENDIFFYISFDTYYSLIAFLLDENNSKIFFKNIYYRWIWSSLWESEKVAKNINNKIRSFQKDKKKEINKKVLKILEGVKLLNSATYILFLKMFYLQEKELLV